MRFLNSDPSHPFNRLPFTANHPQPFPTREFQKGLTDLFGVETQSGRPWLRVVWAPSQERDQWGPLALDWNEYGAGGKGEWRRRYLYSTSESYGESFDEARGLWLSREIWNDVSFPRFVCEKLIPESVMAAGWDDHAELIPGSPGFAEGRDSDGDRFTSRKPIGGLYVPMEVDDRVSIRGGVIADHNEYCCAAAENEERMCYGTFAAPGQAHLEYLQKLTRLIKALPERRPGLVTPAELEELSRRTVELREQYWQDAERRFAERVHEAALTHLPGISEDPTVRAHGKYHWMSGHNKSGTPTKQGPSEWLAPIGELGP
jgi:hypothetical protein